MTAHSAQRVGYREIFAIAGPIMLSNASTPLIGFVDAAVVGQLGVPALIGGVAMASLMFNAIYWVFGFLRMGTSGFAAQAVGARDGTEVTATLFRALAIAVVIGLAIVALQMPIRQAFFAFLGGSAEVQAAASTYYDWRIWAAPAGLVNFALLGWFIGLGRAGIAFWLQFGLNVANIVFALLFALGLGHGVAGVGAAALLAEWLAMVAGIAVALRELRLRGDTVSRSALLDLGKLRRMLAANRDILIRTACVLFAAQLFMRMSAAQGDVELAANALLLNVLYIVYYLLDGYANAAETLVGQSIGACDRARLDDTVTKCFVAGVATAVLMSALLYGGGQPLIAWMTPNPAVRAVVAEYLRWATVMPVIAIWCFVYDGIFIGATRTADMRDMMLVSFIAYLATLGLLVPLIGNHGIWAAHITFFVVRALTLRWKYPALAALTERR